MRSLRSVPTGARFVRAARSLPRDRTATFAVTFSLIVPILILLAGLGIDYLTGLSNKARWDSSADAAALAAVQAADVYVTANAAAMNSATLVTNAEAVAVTAGTQAFNANAGTSETTGTVTPTIVMSQSGTSFTAQVTYTGSVPTHFGPMVGVNNFGVSGSSTASASVTTYINYYILVDISQSMGVGDTLTDMSNLYNLTAAMGYVNDNEPGCVYGCHVPINGYPLSNEEVAHGAGIKLRIDSAKTAIQDVINQAQANAVNGNIKIGIYTLQDNPTASVAPNYAPQTIMAMTNNYTGLTSAVGTIDLGPNTINGWGDSDMADSISNFASKLLQNNGTGFSPNSPQNYVFLITDGLQDIPGYCNITDHCTSAMSTTACAPLQAQATVGVIYTSYLPIYLQNNPANGYDPLYTLLVQPYVSSLQTTLQSCASSSQFFFQANDGPALIVAMNALFAASAQPVRLLH